MPDAKLPTNLKGWAVALVASMIGFIAGFIATGVMSRWLS